MDPWTWIITFIADLRVRTFLVYIVDFFTGRYRFALAFCTAFFSHLYWRSPTAIIYQSFLLLSTSKRVSVALFLRFYYVFDFFLWSFAFHIIFPTTATIYTLSIYLITPTFTISHHHSSCPSFSLDLQYRIFLLCFLPDLEFCLVFFCFNLLLRLHVYTVAHAQYAFVLSLSGSLFFALDWIASIVRHQHILLLPLLLLCYLSISYQVYILTYCPLHCSCARALGLLACFICALFIQSIIVMGVWDGMGWV